MNSTVTYEEVLTIYGVSSKAIRLACGRTAKFFEKNPHLWTKAMYQRKGEEGTCYCAVGRFSVEVGLPSGKAHMILAYLAMKYAETLPDNNIFKHDLSWGRVSTVNDFGCSDHGDVVRLFLGLRKCA